MLSVTAHCVSGTWFHNFLAGEKGQMNQTGHLTNQLRRKSRAAYGHFVLGESSVPVCQCQCVMKLDGRLKEVASTILLLSYKLKA